MNFYATMMDNWPYWVVTVFVIVAAYIDGKQLKVPNKITFPMIIAGWIYSHDFVRHERRRLVCRSRLESRRYRSRFADAFTRVFDRWHGRWRCQNDGSHRSLGPRNDHVLCVLHRYDCRSRSGCWHDPVLWRSQKALEISSFRSPMKSRLSAIRKSCQRSQLIVKVR